MGRLAETDIVAPLGGILADVRTQIGEVIQGGKTTLTGGTVLAVVLDVARLMVRAEVDESDIGRVLAIAPPWATRGHDGEIRMPDDLAEAARAVKHPPVITVESFRDEQFDGVIGASYEYLIEGVVATENVSFSDLKSLYR